MKPRGLGHFLKWILHRFLEAAARLSFQKFVHFTIGGVLQDEINASLVEKVAIHPQDIGVPVKYQRMKERMAVKHEEWRAVPQVGLDLNLTPKLVLHVALLKLRFEEDLEGYNEL